MLLIDELDRTDEAFEAFLLEVLADNQVTIPEMGTVKAAHPPIVVITSNRTREIHDALKRRCLYHWVGYPTAERELKIVRAKVPGIGKKLSQEVVHFVQALRAQDLFKSPGVAESLDWAAALTELDVVALDPATVSDTLGVLLEVSGRHRAHRRHQGEGIARPGARGDAGGGVAGPMAQRRAGWPKTSSTSRARCAPPGSRLDRALCSIVSVVFLAELAVPRLLLAFPLCPLLG